MPSELLPQDVGPIGAKHTSPCTLMIFSDCGDLTKRLLMPSLHNLTCVGLPYDCTLSDATLFQRNDNTEAGLAAVDPLLEG